MKHIVSRMSSYFPNRWPLSYLNLTKNMKTYIRRQQHKNFKHQDIKQKEPLQKYRLGTISNTKLLVGLTIDANFDYRDSIAIVEITITILSLSWHTITILSRYYRFSTKLSLKGVYLEQSRKLSPFSAVG